MQGRDSFWRKHHKVTDDVDPQVKKILVELGIKVRYALSPQAKGKVERPYRWLQDRIVRICAREGVKEISDGIKVLKTEAERYNFRQRHSVTGEVPYYRLKRLSDEGKSLFREFVLPAPYLSSKDIFALRERTVIGMKQAVKEDKWLWQTPYGYVFDRSHGKGYMVIKDDEANVIKEIFRLFDEGYRGKELIDRIKKSGFNLYKQRLSKILKNPVYKGKIKVKKWFNDEEIDGLHEAIVNEELFDRVQFKLGIYDNFQKPKSRIHKDFPLRGTIYCPLCGMKLTGAFSTGRNQKYPYYRCSTKG